MTAYLVTCSMRGNVLNPWSANCRGPVTVAWDTFDWPDTITTGAVST